MMQFGVAWPIPSVVPAQFASVEHIVPESMPSGSASGVAIGLSTVPHTGQPSMPEHAESAQSTAPLQSLSMPSLQTSGPVAVQLPIGLLFASGWLLPSSSPV